MQIYNIYAPIAKTGSEPGAISKGCGQSFAKQLEAVEKNQACGRNCSKPDKIHLGTISASQPTVSHLLASHEDFRNECWKIVHCRSNAAKPYTRIPEGTDVYLDPLTKEITWGSADKDNKTDLFSSQREVMHYGSSMYFPKQKADLAQGSQEIIREAIDAAAAKHNLPKDLIAGVIRAESNFNENAVSTAGAQGLMQLMPETALELGVENPFDIRQNIEAGTRYLRKMLDLFDGDIEKALAAYNAGPGTVKRYNGQVPYAETQNYVAKVMSYLA
jgi:hypothetical protein